MRYRHAVFLQFTTHQNGAMAGQRILFCAHEGDAIPLSAGKQAVDARGEHRQLRNPVIARVAINVAFRFVSSCAELAAQKQVTHPRCVKTRLHGLSGEMREARTARLRSHVGHDFNGVALQVRSE
jgi:hypothetical protein